MSDQESGLIGVLIANRARITRFLRARLGDDSEAEDALHDLWIKLQASPSGPVADPLAYVYRMAANAASDRRRSALRRGRRDSDWAGTGQLDEASAKLVSAEQMLIVRDELARVERALAALPERTSRIFRAFRVEGVSQKAIAAEHGISISAVEKHLQRAYRTILAVRKALDADEPVR
ncbi:MAG: polymerase sigma factor [Sphingomonas bacterium]|jgi:RNA polymerase sigma factor (sigma-70 family)|nr:polymerase sigma factor [Sphingomonas bacterium]MDB5684758.1 polymerase sigma factor [Sphingomonas bacterium]MDB5717497.1 polymerase sigma factor [Sphingomonas bacterium]